ncbi:GRIP-like protein [Drosera capensis]
MSSSSEDDPDHLRKNNTDDDGDRAVANGFHRRPELVDPDEEDDLVQMVVEMRFQNEYLKSKFEELRRSLKETEERGGEEELKGLREKVGCLGKELAEQKEMRSAAEEALKFVRSSHEEADARANELSVQLAQAREKMEKELKERDGKYSELDSKFTRLHKRAKQRIQDVQKEKDDLEAQLQEVNERAEKASSQLSALQQELERTRQQENEALKAMDVEKQQLRSANNKLRDTIEELRHSLEPKEHALEALQQSLLDKEQMVENMRGLLEAAEERRQNSIAELSAKHLKQAESLETQLAEAISDGNKAAGTISSLQVLLAEKESKIAEMDAALSGEAARLNAAVESVKAELVHQTHEHEKEKEKWESTHQALKQKLKVAESKRVDAELEAAKTRSQFELELSVQKQLLGVRDGELAAAREKISQLEAEFSAYKVRAHSLLQKKDAELAAAMDSEQLRALEESLKEAEKEIISLSEEKEKVIKELQDAVANLEKILSARDAALASTEKWAKDLEMKLDSANLCYRTDKEVWELNLKNLEDTWHSKYETLREQMEVSSAANLQEKLENIKLQYTKLKEEHDSFRDLADRMIGEKDQEISRLLDDNKNLKQSLASRSQVDRDADLYTAPKRQDISSISAEEQQILILARQQAQREEELAQSQRHILALQEEIEELVRENQLHSQQEAMLKEELRNMERMQKREGVDMTYLKNVVLKLLQTGEVEALLPVVAMLLQFSPEEVKFMFVSSSYLVQKCQQAYRNSSDVPPSPEGSGRSLFSRFSFV